MRSKRTFGRVAKVRLDVYSQCKYTAPAEALDNPKVAILDGLESWDIVDGEDAEEIEKHTDGSCIDDFHEYLVLHFTDGSSSTYRNSYVDMLRWW